jgi:uncharacterized protein YggE
MMGPVLGMVILLAGTTALAAEPEWKERTVRVSASGEAVAPPDQAVIEFEVLAESERLEKAADEAKARMAAVLKAIRSLGVADKYLQTLRYNVQPKYRYDKDGGEQKRVGFIVSNRVRAVLMDLDQAGKVLEAVARAGATHIAGPHFGFSDPSKLEIQALKSAMGDARRKAEALAEAAGASLGKVLSVQSSSQAAPPPRPMMMRAMAAEADVPIERGEGAVTAQVEVVYSLK